MTRDIRLPTHSSLAVCYGMGVDSTAMLIALRDAGIRPDLITFADTGGEKPETYAYLPTIQTWLAANDFPPVTTVAKKTLPTTPYNDLGGNCLANHTLPSLAFGMKSCSIKWKQDPQDNLLRGVSRGPNQAPPHPLWERARSTGQKILKLIGYDYGPADIRRAKKVKKEGPHFLYDYPLQMLRWDRQACTRRIAEEGLPVPVKSACYYCPASQKWELWWLAGTHPDLFMDALDIEMAAMLGKHSRWQEQTCDFGKKWEDLIQEPADRWPTLKITVGLGRSFAWNHWAREHGIVDRATGRFIADRDHCLAMAERLQRGGGNAHDNRTCAQCSGCPSSNIPTDLLSLLT